MSKKLIGMDAKTRKWGDDIFGAGFEAGAQARIAARVPSPTRNKPKRSAKIPAEYIGRNARRLWVSGWKAGYAFGMPNSKAGNERCRRRALAWQQALSQRGCLRIHTGDLVGHWRARRGAYTKFLNLVQGGSLTGKVVKGKTLVEDVIGKWSLDDDCLVFDFASNLYGGEMGALFRTRSVIMKLSRDHFVIAISETIRDRYTRDR